MDMIAGGGIEGLSECFRGVISVETKTIPAFHDVYSCSSLPRLDSPPRNAHSTFQQVMSPAIADNLLAAVYVASSIVGAGENHAKPKTVFAVHRRCTVNSKKRY